MMFATMTKSLLVVACCITCNVRGNVQESFPSGGSAFDPYDTGLFWPLEDLELLSSTEFTTLGHPKFPKYGVRIKKSDFCDGTVRAFTGYIDIEARHLFFYFFESRNEPDTDDVIFWTNGGPGCSSSTGLFMELGPCRVTTRDNTTFNPYSWNEKANIFFIDQPIGTGFSYADYGEYVSTTEEAAKDIGAFVAIFFEHFSAFKGRSFHMAGESYGGRAVPAYASYIYDQNPRLVEAGMTPINLTSIMIGNGLTDQLEMFPSYHELQCTSKSVPPLLSISECVQQKRALPRCVKWLKEGCFDTDDKINCLAAYEFCSQTIVIPFAKLGYNPYDLEKICDDPDFVCYPISKNISAYLDHPELRRQIGVDSSFTANFSHCNYNILQRFASNADSFFPTKSYIAALLERGVRALIYVGANDWICNWVANERMTLGMEWTGQESFRSQPLRDWRVGDHVAGRTRSAGVLTFATISGAGHMAPYDKPAESLELIKRWLAGEEL